MNAVKEWAIVICLAALIGTIVEMITPLGSMEKIVRFVLGAFMLCAIIIPLFTTIQKININISHNANVTANATNFQQKVNSQVSTAAAEEIKKLSCDILEKESIKVQKINVFMDTSQTDSISINKVTVYLNKQDSLKKGKAKQLLENGLQLPVEIIVEQG